jgi:predicted RNase H-like nuclease
VREVHPEVSFYFWNHERPMTYPKQTGFGFAERYQLTRAVFDDAADRIRAAVPRTAASDDDVLDALAALWTARRIYTGDAVRIPATGEQDVLGLPMEILA